MNRIKKRINLTLVKQLIAAGEPCLVSDTEILGFQVRVAQRSVTFRYRWCKNNTEKLFTIGRYPTKMPDAARSDALRLVAQLSTGGIMDLPGARPIPLVGEMFDHYVDHVKNKANATSVFKKLAHLRARKITELKKEDITAVRDSLSDHRATANLVVKYVSGAFTLICRDFALELPNPASDIQLFHVEPRKRFLTEEEAPKLLDEIERMRYVPRYSAQAYALLMMIYTGARKSNVLMMNLSEITRDVWTIPFEKSKNGKEIVAPLNKYALEIVETRSKVAVDGYLFTWRGKPMSDVRKTFKAACDAVGVAECHVHDLRRTLGSWMLMNGTPIEVVSKTLGHSSIRVTEQVYAHLLPKKISTATGSAVSAMRKGVV